MAWRRLASLLHAAGQYDLMRQDNTTCLLTPTNAQQLALRTISGPLMLLQDAATQFPQFIPTSELV
jgi:hypothetical protein